MFQPGRAAPARLVRRRLGLRDQVALDHIEHRVTVVGFVPPLDFVEDDQRRALAFQGKRARRDGLDHPADGGVDDRFVDLDAELGLKRLRGHGREEREGVGSGPG